MNVSRAAATIGTLGIGAMMLTGCASGASGAEAADEVRLGYFANVTHAPALVGVQRGLFQDALGDAELKPELLGAGPAAIEALTAGSIDAAYVGPNPAINTYIQSGGRSARIVAGATSGGASLAVRDGIDSAADLAGADLASPQLGNTQDVALRTWLADSGYETSITSGGDVTITPTSGALALTLFQKGELDGAWLPEPWASRLVVDAGADVLVDEADLWPDGAFPTTVLLVRADFADERPDLVEKLIAGHVEAVDWLNDNDEAAPDAVNRALTDATGQGLTDEVLHRALGNVTFSVDPHAGAFEALVADGIAAGTQKEGPIDGIFDLAALNAQLERAGRQPVSAGGLGADR